MMISKTPCKCVTLGCNAMRSKQCVTASLQPAEKLTCCSVPDQHKCLCVLDVQ